MNPHTSGEAMKRILNATQIRLILAITTLLSFSARAQETMPDPSGSQPDPAASSDANSPSDSQTDSSNSPEAIKSDMQSGEPVDERTSTETTRKVIRTRERTKLEDLATSLIFAADLGFQTALPSTKLKDFGPKFGLAIEGKALGSVTLGKYILDGGVGWYFYNLSGKEPRRVNGIILTDDADVALTDDVGIKLSGTVFEFSPSYLINKDIFAGPVFQFRYPSDLGYDSLIERNKLAFIFGAQGGYQILDEDLNTRFVGRIITPINDINWLSMAFMVGVQVGLPFIQPEIVTVKETTTKTTEKRVVEYRKQEYKVQVTKEVTKLLLDNLIVFYDDPGYPTLTQEAQSFLISLSESLRSVESEWKLLRIETISKDHAQVIRDSLISAGLPENKVRIGKVIPGQRVTNPAIEFAFYGVKDPDKLSDSVRSSMKAMQINESE